MSNSNAFRRLVAAGALALAASSAQSLPPVGEAPPDFALRSVAGPNIRLSEYRGDVVLLTFWASWCGECAHQIEQAARLHQRYGEAGVELIAVSLDREMRSAASGAEALGGGFPLLHDAGGVVGEAYDVRRLPTMVLIGRDGRVREVFEGYERGDEDAYLASLREVLREL